MKTSEFIRRLGPRYGAVSANYGQQLKVVDCFHDEVASISCLKQSDVILFTNDIELAKLCIEYAETPILERRDVKKYIAKIPDPENLSTERIYTLVRAFNGNIMISRPQTKRILDNEAYHLTEEEIKRNHAYLWEFAEEVK